MKNNLPVTRASIVEALAAVGASEITIREELGLTAKEWKKEIRIQDSDLAQAMQDGRSRMVESAFAVVLQSIAAGDVATAKWLIGQLGPKEQKAIGEGININLTLPMAMEDYMKVHGKVVEDD